MTLVFEIPFLGVEVFRVTLDIEQEEPQEINAVDKASKWISREFFKRMIR